MTQTPADSPHHFEDSAGTSPSAGARVAVHAADADRAVQARAAELARWHHLPLVEAPDAAYDMLLTVTVERLELRFTQPGAPRPVFVDFVGGSSGHEQRGNRFGLLFNAVGFRTGRPTVLDATAGLGRDAFRLAYHGCRVTAVERAPVLFALLEDGLARAKQDPVVLEHLGDNLHIIHEDARDLLQKLPREDAPDVVYLDPMFPPKRKSALVKKEMRILRQLVGTDPDALELFACAYAAARRRVVVKRHVHAAPLAPNPTHSHRDKTTRYDVYVPPRRTQDATETSGDIPE